MCPPDPRPGAASAAATSGASAVRRRRLCGVQLQRVGRGAQLSPAARAPGTSPWCSGGAQAERSASRAAAPTRAARWRFRKRRCAHTTTQLGFAAASKNSGGTGSPGRHSCTGPSSTAIRHAQNFRRRVSRVPVRADLLQADLAPGLDVAAQDVGGAKAGIGSYDSRISSRVSARRVHPSSAPGRHPVGAASTTAAGSGTMARTGRPRIAMMACSASFPTSQPAHCARRHAAAYRRLRADRGYRPLPRGGRVPNSGRRTPRPIGPGGDLGGDGGPHSFDPRVEERPALAERVALRV